MAALFAKLSALISKEPEAKEETNVWRPKHLMDIPPTTFQRIMLFLIYDKPTEMNKWKLVNKYFNKLFDIEYGGTNFLWRIICQNRFKHISPKHHTKRWDKLYQIGLMTMKREVGTKLILDEDVDKMRHTFAQRYQNVHNIKDIEDIGIEGCNLGLPQSQKLSLTKQLALKTGIKSEDDVLNGLKFNDILVKNSLIEDGHIWFIQCPILQNNYNFNRIEGDDYRSMEEYQLGVDRRLQYDEMKEDDVKNENENTISTRFKNINYCRVCNKHVYNVDNERDLNDYLENGSCVSFSGKLVTDPIIYRKRQKVGGGACLVM